MKQPSIDLIQHLVRVLYEIFQALEKLHREAIRPHHHVGMAVETKDLLQARQILHRIVEEIFAVAERRALGDHVQQIELVYAHRQAEVDDLVDVGNVLLVDAHVDVDDDPSLAQGSNHSLHQLPEGSRCAGETIVQLGCVSVQAEGDLVETGFDRSVVELALGEHEAVGDGLHPGVADLSGVADEIDELGMQRTFAAGEDYLVGAQLFPPAPNLVTHVVFRNVHVARRVAIQAEDATAVACRHATDPVLPDVGDTLARQHPVLQVLMVHRAVLSKQMSPRAVVQHPAVC
jgi:hypothetical protein